MSIAEYLPLSSPDTDTDAQPEPQRVAVKALKAAMVESERNVMDFIEEVRVLSRLKHK